MTEESLKILHNKYQIALEKSSNILEIVTNYYDILQGTIFCEEDTKEVDSFLDGLRGTIKYRRKTFELTNIIIYLNITFMYIILWLNEEHSMAIDIQINARRKALESELTKLLDKAISAKDISTINIRDRFGLRAILLNKYLSDSCESDTLHCIFETFIGIVCSKNRKMRNEFSTWINQKEINILDKNIVKNTLKIPYEVIDIKDFIKNPKENNYQTLQFTLMFAMDSEVLPGCRLEIQLRSKKMHDEAENGEASHNDYKENEIPKEIREVFVVDDFSTFDITGFTGYAKEEDSDGIHFPKNFANRRISDTLVY